MNLLQVYWLQALKARLSNAWGGAKPQGEPSDCSGGLKAITILGRACSARLLWLSQTGAALARLAPPRNHSDRGFQPFQPWLSTSPHRGEGEHQPPRFLGGRTSRPGSGVASERQRSELSGAREVEVWSEPFSIAPPFRCPPVYSLSAMVPPRLWPLSDCLPSRNRSSSRSVHRTRYGLPLRPQWTSFCQSRE